MRPGAEKSLTGRKYSSAGICWKESSRVFSDCCKILLSAGVPGGRRDENSRAVQDESEQDGPGEGRAFIDKSRVYQIYSNQGVNYLRK